MFNLININKKGTIAKSNFLLQIFFRIAEYVIEIFFNYEIHVLRNINQIKKFHNTLPPPQKTQKSPFLWTFQPDFLKN